MNLVLLSEHCEDQFIKVCQCKDQNDDSTNAKYFDLLDSILADCEAELDTPLETLHLHDTAVSVLYQLVLICPLASLTSIIPKLVPVLVDVIRLNEASEFVLNLSCYAQGGSEVHQEYENQCVRFMPCNLIEQKSLLVQHLPDDERCYSLHSARALVPQVGQLWVASVVVLPRRNAHADGK